jgi:hypothetical protein
MAKKRDESATKPAAPKAPPPAPASAPATVGVTEETLLATRGKALALLAAVGREPGIRLALGSRGYTEAVHQEGWSALHAASGFTPGAAPVAQQPPAAVAVALRSVDAWDDTNFPIADAALEHRHPEAHAVLFGDGLSAGSGAESLVRVETFLDRVDSLERSHPAAVETLAARAITRDERHRLRALIKTAKSFTPTDTQAQAQRDAARESSRKQQDASLRVLRAWYEEWATIAKRVIQRRDWLIQMGLATRKSPERKKPIGA